MQPLEQQIARMFGFGFPSPELDPDTKTLLTRGAGAAILFARNVTSPAQTADLCAQLKRHAAHRPLPIAVDQEGGRVMRLRSGFTPIPSMRALGHLDDQPLAEKVGQVLGAELRAVNIDIDFAPVVDVDSNPANPVIADRSLGPDPARVARLARALIRGIQSQHVAACAKHFPGHGDTALDSHHNLPRLPHSLERLERVELPPFQAAIHEGVASIMTNHVIFEPLDPDFPTTMSRPCLDGILRDRMRFDGVVFSDDMEMKAIANHYGLEQALTRGANAGVDLFWICHSAEKVHQAIDHILHAVERGQVPRARIQQANRRLDTLNKNFCLPPEPFDPTKLHTPAHQAVTEEIRQRVDAALLHTGIDPTDFLKLKLPRP